MPSIKAALAAKLPFIFQFPATRKLRITHPGCRYIKKARKDTGAMAANQRRIGPADRNPRIEPSLGRFSDN
jgi:hypothetical protein